jgi:urea carboxylase
VLIVVESMKMETAVVSPCEGVVHQVLCKAGGIVESGQTLVVVVGELKIKN